MRLSTPCFTCHTERQTTGAPPSASVYAELNEDGVAVGVCVRGHQVTVTVQQPRYETLFDWACLALSDGYSREAVATFSASLERFYEISLRALCTHMGMNHQAIETTWKRVAKQSERQLGAFLFVYAAHIKAVPTLWDEKLTTFRNNVVHNGHFASQEKARWYGEACYKQIHTVAAELRSSCPEAWNAEFFRQARERYTKYPSSSVQHSPVSPVYTIIDRPVPPFEEALQSFLQHNMWRREAVGEARA